MSSVISAMRLVLVWDRTERGSKVSVSSVDMMASIALPIWSQPGWAARKASDSCTASVNQAITGSPTVAAPSGMEGIAGLEAGVDATGLVFQRFGSFSTMGCRQLLGQPDIIKEQTHRQVLLIDECLDVTLRHFLPPVALVLVLKALAALILADTIS